jgi:hypothetical protein
MMFWPAWQQAGCRSMTDKMTATEIANALSPPATITSAQARAVVAGAVAMGAIAHDHTMVNDDVEPFLALIAAGRMLSLVDTSNGGVALRHDPNGSTDPYAIGALMILPNEQHAERMRARAGRVVVVNDEPHT